MPLDAEEKENFLDAAEHNNLTTVKYYVEEQHASLFVINEELQTLVHIAAKNGYTDLLKYVAKKEPSIVADKDLYGNSAFYLANIRGAVDIIKYLIEEHGPNVTRSNPRHFFSAAMHTAVEFGHLNTLKYFIEGKHDINILNERRESLLFTAIEYGHHHIVKYLVEEKKADVTLLNINRANILYPIVPTNDLPLMKYFLDERKAAINVNWQDKFGNTLLHRAAIMNRTSIMKYLVDEKHADVNIAGHENMTPLHYAASRNHQKVCKYLIEHGANTTCRDDAGQIPIQKATDKSLIEYMRSVTSANRIRRSVGSVIWTFPSISIYKRPQQISQTNLSLPLENSYRSETTFLGNIYSSRLQIFLVIAKLMVGNMKRICDQDESNSLESISTILQEKIDPIAIESIGTVPVSYTHLTLPTIYSV